MNSVSVAAAAAQLEVDELDLGERSASAASTSLSSSSLLSPHHRSLTRKSGLATHFHASLRLRGVVIQLEGV